MRWHLRKTMIVAGIILSDLWPFGNWQNGLHGLQYALFSARRDDAGAGISASQIWKKGVAYGTMKRNEHTKAAEKFVARKSGSGDGKRSMPKRNRRISQ